MTISGRGKWLAGGLLALVAFVFLTRHRDEVVGAAQASPVANLVQNPGFQANTNTPPANWFVDADGSRKGRISLAANAGADGSTAVLLEPNSLNTGGDRPLAVAQVIPAANLGGRTLRFAAQARTDGGAVAAALLLAVKDGAVQGSAVLRQSGTGPIKLMETTFTVASGSDSLMLILCAEGTTGRVWYDDVYVGSPVEVSAVAPAGALKASITIDSRTEIRDIPRSLYGSNVEWILNANGIWDEKTKDFDPDLVRLTREWNLGVLRFPGGVFSDFYRWQEGIGPLDKRPESLHYVEGPRSRQNFGTDEMIRFAQAVGSELLFTVNAGTGTAQDAADWVRYVKDRGLRPGSPGRVSFWEVGNELYIRDDHPSSRTITIPPDVYARRYLDFAKAMKQADASIRIGAIAGLNQGPYALVGYSNWLEILLAKAGSDIDFIAVHNAYSPGMAAETRKLPVEKVYAAMMASPVLIGRNLTDISAAIRRNTAKDIQIAITEWGPYFHVSPSSSWVDHNKTLASAIYTASAMAQFLQSPQTSVATSFKLSDAAAFMAWIGKREGRFEPNADYLAMQLYSRHFGTTLVKATTDAPTYDSERIGLVDAVKGVPYVDCVASRDAGRKKLYWIAVNKHASAAIPLTFTFSGLRPKGPWTVRTLTGPALDAHTGTELPSVPGLNWAAQETLATQSSFNARGGGNVHVEESTWAPSGTALVYSLPARSVVAFEAAVE